VNFFADAIGSQKMTRMRPERASAPAGLSPMTTSKKYRDFAEECERLAATVKDDRHSKVLEEMAAVWRMLAADADKAQSI